MPRITVLPHPECAPTGAQFEVCAMPGKAGPVAVMLCDALLEHGVALDHACGKVGACTTCHVIIKSGSATLNAPDENEEDMLDRAWGLEPQSRLACQVRVPESSELVVEIPRYSINHAKENS